MHDRATVGEVTTVVLLMQMLSTPVIELVRSLEWLEEGAASLARLFGVGTVPPDRHPVASTPRQDSPSVIRLSGVRFGYTPEREVLHNVDLAVCRGERLALVGPTGAGKSTLARIIAGIHPPASGTATVAGVPLTGLRPDQLRPQPAQGTRDPGLAAARPLRRIISCR
jgi:ABC-type multidrug transport system fused ATPase/permease subunit